MALPTLVARAVRQAVEDVGSNYVVLPLHSYEAWALASGSDYPDGWSRLKHLCWEYDDDWDDEMILFCVKAKGHGGEHGKPNTR